MNYIRFLTQEEKSMLCGIITGKNFKELFKKNEQQFSRIRKGFRAKSLSDQLALSIAVANVDKPFIATYINDKVDIWVEEIQANIDMLEDKGLTHDVALATTMLDSVFASNTDLYFKLIGQDLDINDRSKLREKMENIQIESAQQSIHSIKTEYEQKIQKN